MNKNTNLKLQQTIKGIVLAGGKGTRLRPLTNETPKPLLPVGQYRLVEHALSYLVAADVTDVVIIIQAEHLEKFIEVLGDGNHLGLTRLQYAYNDDIAQGIPYAISRAEKFVPIGSKLMVVCGDILFDPGYAETLKNMQEYDGAVVFTAYMEDSAGYGLLQTEKHRVTKIFSKDKERHVAGFIELGTCLLPYDVFGIFNKLETPERELGFKDVYQIYLLEQRLYFCSIKGWWSDVGNSIEEYKRICKRYN